MNNVLILDKPSGLTSAKAVDKIKSLLGFRKAGHTGTLDPFATGVLPICFNQATKAIPYFCESIKEYEAEMVLGISTDTLDGTGKVISENSSKLLDKDFLIEVFNEFIGHQRQIPPMYSAVKVGGVRLYKYAHEGKEIERKPKEILIKDIKLLDYDHPRIKYLVKCSKGTYIRVLNSDIGNRLGCGAHLHKLRRISSGNFRIEDASSIEGVQRGYFKLYSLKDVLRDKKQLEVNKDLAKLISNGVQITKNDLSEIQLPNFEKEDIITILFNEKVVSICEALIDKDQFEYVKDKDIILRHLRVFN